MTLFKTLFIPYRLPKASGDGFRSASQARYQDCRPLACIPLYWPLTWLICHYRLESSRAQRLLVLLEELKLNYTIKAYKRNKDALAPEEMKNIHLLGKSPSVEIQISGQAPFVLAESGAIFEYLCENFGKQLIPARVVPELEGNIGAETEEFRRNRYFMHYAEGSLMSLLAIAAVMLSMYT